MLWITKHAHKNPKTIKNYPTDYLYDHEVQCYHITFLIIARHTFYLHLQNVLWTTVLMQTSQKPFEKLPNSNK